ncbi:Transient receptor potential cation channel subfamily A member 1 [Amphibalanus amphitrite]|uniref:Transient receptor potential cation channel subfamily A member 1 n=1 Tax=Amphibalanus amphitrite TaxID=1232801 RepID=A0A6A4WAY3_AMPAM|nr:Transient receptor potential cation channel subfamily A member 1 [Amphibalanus amphitrite]
MPLESITFFIVAFTCVYIDLRETIKMWVLGVMPYLRGPENVITWFCTSTAIACLCTDVLTFEQLRQVAAACLLASWTELLFMFGRAEFASMHVMLFVTLIRTLSVFMMVYTAITFAFTSSFFVLFCDKPDEFDGRFDTMTSAFFTTLHGSKGGYAIYLLFIFFMLIITMNAMVGMAVNDTRDMAAKAEIKLHKKYIEFAHLFERHQQGRLAASWHVLPGPQLGWRHRWRVMFPGKEGGYAAQRTKGTEQLRQWLAQWPGLLRQAARIVIIKHHDSWDQPSRAGQ